MSADELRALADSTRGIANLIDGLANRANLRRAAAALDQAASDRAALDRLREALTWHPTCDVHPDDDVITCGWKRAVASITWALRDEQGASAGRTDWVDDAAPLPRPERNDE